MQPDSGDLATQLPLPRAETHRRSLRSALKTLVAYALYLIPSLLLVIANRRLIQLTNLNRIGHLAGEMDCLLKESLLDPGASHKGVLLAPRDRVANNRIVDYWAKYVSVIRSPWLCRLLNPMYRLRHVRFRDDMARYVATVDETAGYIEIQRRWGDRPPLLALTADDVARGRDELAKMGVPHDVRFVCFHNREGGYSPSDEQWHSYRNCNVLNYLEAARCLVERGIYCVRLGDPTTQPLPRMPGVVDYAHSDSRSDWMDVFLCAQCEFFIGNSSGPLLLAGAFGRPMCLANLVPLSTVLPFGPRDLGIPKLLWHEQERRYLTFREIFESQTANFRFSRLYREHGILPMENPAEDIRDLALESLDRLAGRASYTEEDERLQARFKALMRPGHTTYGSASRIGRDFMRKYAYLIGDKDKP